MGDMAQLPRRPDLNPRSLDPTGVRFAEISHTAVIEDPRVSKNSFLAHAPVGLIPTPYFENSEGTSHKTKGKTRPREKSNMRHKTGPCIPTCTRMALRTGHLMSSDIIKQPLLIPLSTASPAFSYQSGTYRDSIE